MATVESLTWDFPPHPPVTRADGCHLGKVVNDLNNLLFPRQVYPEWDAMTPEQQRDTLMLWEMGFLWEDTLSTVMGDRIAPRPPEICVDGIYCNADGIDIEAGEIHEYKCTASSMSKGVLANWRWMMQVKGYCFAFTKHFNKPFTKARFFVLWEYGDYSKPTRKVPGQYLVTFSEQEVVEAWRLLSNHARSRGWLSADTK